MASSQVSSRSASVMRRRVVAVVLVVLSLALLTIYFRESSGGGLHSVQSAGSTVLRPFEVAANRVAQPFRDAASWIGSLADAKSDRDKYKAELAKARTDLARFESVQAENRRLRKDLHYIASSSFPSDYIPIPTSVVAHPSSQFDQSLVVEVGKNDGVQRNSPVVTPDGLVGQVTTLYSQVSRVTLITDESSFVGVSDLNTGATGILRHGTGSSIIIDGVPKAENVFAGDVITTSGWRVNNLASLFPRDIPVGTVSSVTQIDTEPYKQISIKPYVDFGSLQSVIILRKKPGVR